MHQDEQEKKQAFEAQATTTDSPNYAELNKPRTYRQRLEQERNWGIKSLSIIQRKIELFESLPPHVQKMIEELIIN